VGTDIEYEKLTKKEAKRAAKGNRDVIGASNERDVKLYLKSPVNSQQVKEFMKCMKRSENLQIAWEGWSVEEGRVIAISVQEPIDLPGILNEMPMVEEAHKKGQNIQVMLTNSIN